MKLPPHRWFQLLTALGLLALFVQGRGEPPEFFLFLLLLVMTLWRWRVPSKGGPYTVVLDAVMCYCFYLFWNGSVIGPALWITIFQAMYLGIYPVALLILLFPWNPLSLAIALMGIFLRFWGIEHSDKMKTRDTFQHRNLQLLRQQEDLTLSLHEVEQMAMVGERARISRDLHDHAGHDIIAGYISLQTIRDLLDTEDAEILELYDTALKRLDAGVQQMREAVHNMATVNFLGASHLQDMCQRFPTCPVKFRTTGDSSLVSSHQWQVLKSCLSESLTNITRHSEASQASVELDITPQIIRLYIENDGVKKGNRPLGNGLRNLRHRTTAIGGNLSVNAGDKFQVIVVLPL